ncbi:MAG: NADH-quinone oxidoreductase subunit NuoE [Lentisphaerae bacterium]|nr:NADH-quinone oxidoreductase subunit NuoE [Lentisphaerota bacterium]
MAILEREGAGGRAQCIKILQELQAAYGYLPALALQYVADHSAISKRQLYGVATFYDQFRFTPIGRHVIRVCHGTACHVNGANRITQAIEELLDFKDQDTTTDGLFTLETVACLGCCSLAPVMMIDEVTYGRLTPEKTRQILQRYRQQAAPSS